MKPWEETWEVNRIAGDHLDDGDGHDFCAFYPGAGQLDVEPGRMRLASAAPEMARMLLKHARRNYGRGDASYLCIECGSPHEGACNNGCALDALLRKAGVRE